MRELKDGIEQQFAEWLRDRFGPAAGVAAARLDRAYPLFAEEEAHVAHAVLSRRLEFSVGRWCARRALSELGFLPQPILVGERREPLWPCGACGSISHAGGACAAVAARSTDLEGLGIDIVDLAEARLRLTGAVSVFAGEKELSAARAAFARTQEGAHVLGLLFSAKESAIKAMSARVDRFLEFTDVTVQFDGAAFFAECACFETHARGWWAVRDGYGFTAAVATEHTP